MVMMMTEQFTPQEIRDLRKEMDCSQEEFCKIMAITVATLSRWETGKVVPHGRNHDLLSFLRKEIEKGADPQKLKKVLLIGGVLAFRGVSPVALMASGLLSKEFINSSIDELYGLSDTGKDE
jgi:transcriptional regulator with XRE-family HTH domain